MKKDSYIMKYGLLFFAIGLYSCTSICSKLASGYRFLSWGFVLFYGLEIVVLMLYAVLWQQILKRFELAEAYAFRPIATILSFLWAVLIFDEQVTWNMVVGAAVILTGIWVVNGEHGK